MKRRFKGIGLVAGLAALWGAGGVAHAQDEPDRKPLAVKVGLYFALNEDARRAGGSGMLHMEADYTLQSGVEGNSLSYTQLGIGLTQRRDLQIIPITLSQVYRDPNATQDRGFYYGLGLGIYVVDMETAGTSGKKKNLFGGSVIGGMEFGNNIFGEVEYHLISRYDKKNVSGLQLAVGMRF